MTVTWEKSQHTSLLLWDLDREFQNSYEAYEQWQARNHRKRSAWTCLGLNHKDDTLGRALSLGRQVQRLMDIGKEMFGVRFEQGDSTCHTILSAQLLRLQYEIRQPLYDGALYPLKSSILFDDLIMAAKSIRRTCLTALQDQLSRFESREFVPMLPPPRFRVDYCPFADQLRKDQEGKKSSSPRTKRAHPNKRYDDRELCPHCDACVSVTPHSGLPDYRRILFMSHTALDPRLSDDKATFACNSCYKTFDDSYAFLDHVFQKQIGSDRSCMRRASSRFTMYEHFMESDPSLVEQCLKNCLLRELTRVRTQKMKSTIRVVETEIHPASRGTANIRTSQYFFPKQ
ncbi:hypothetical protein CC86DRAFT_181615 [Ophiobolus disseminans]|uniref:C2H2-type domain-containing protein n=1 Tax=Ophiobolus disseminans TaxID=1469910 RepID=A0A6A7ABD0_9PLEO|nr:hypothetical protein CC86DRAFT_181615 [Ophiobolus disseminans]